MLTHLDQQNDPHRGLEPLQDWQWWLEPQILLGLYVCGFAAQNTYLSGFKFISTDLLDKNYLISGMLCFVIIGITYFFVFASTKESLSEYPYDKFKWKFSKGTDLYLIGGFNLATAASTVGAITTHGAAPILIVFWAAVLGIEAICSNLKNRYFYGLLARCAGLITFVYTYQATLGEELVACLFALVPIYCLRRIFEGGDLNGAWVINSLIVLLAFAAVYGKYIHPLVKYEYGGGEPKNFIIRYQDELSTGSREQNYVTVSAPLIYASDSIIYVRQEKVIKFIRRDKIVSMEDAK